MRQLTRRLLPKQDLREEIESLAQEHEIKAGIIVSAVGCLTRLRLRMADGKSVQEWSEAFEIVSVTGTVSQDGCHIHLSASNQSGATIGGHLKDGCIVGTTVEIVILIFDDVEYLRKSDTETGYEELVVKEV